MLDWETQRKLHEVVTPSRWKNIDSQIPDILVYKVYPTGWLLGPAGFWGQTDERKGSWVEGAAWKTLSVQKAAPVHLSTEHTSGAWRPSTRFHPQLRSGQLCQVVRNGPITGSEHLKKGILRQHEGMFLWQQKLEVIIHKTARLGIVLVRKKDKWHKTSIILASLFCDLLKTA